MSLRKLSKVAVEGRRVAAAGGARIGAEPPDRSGPPDRSASLLFDLTRRGLALPNLGGISRQSLCGFLATGSAGGSFDHDLGAAVRRMRLVDGRGEVQEVTAEDPRLRLFGVAMGLLGVVTEVELEAEPEYAVIGSEWVVPRQEAPFDLLAAGEASAFDFLARHDYARILWWPQAGAERFAIWSARRMRGADYDQRTGPRADFRPRPSRALPWVLGADAPAQALAALGLRATATVARPWFTARIFDAFFPAGRRTFWDRWDRALPMDDAIDERLLPVQFAELWFSRARAATALARLDEYFQRFGARSTRNLAVELYAGAASPFLMSPGFERPSLRVNLMHFGVDSATAARRFAPLWGLFEDLSPRLHWGKHLPPLPHAKAFIARAWPRLDEFLAAREDLDPHGVFLNDYFAARLGVERRRAVPVATDLGPAAVGAPESDRRDARPRVWSPRWPLAFDLEPIGLDFEHRAARRLTYSAECFADPTALFDAFSGLDDGRAWMPQFLGIDRDRRGPGAVFEERFTFLRLRGRTLAFDRPHRWTARVEATSLPLAQSMLETFDVVTHPSGRSMIAWIIHLDPHPLSAPVEPLLRRAFDAWLGRSLGRLGRYAEAQAGIVRGPRNGSGRA